MPLSDIVKRLSIDDSLIECSSYIENKISLCDKFSLDVWYTITADFDSESEWKDFLLEFSDYAQCYVFYRRRDHMPIAFAFFLQEDDKGKVVSVHGGGWYKTIECTMLYYRCYICLIQVLLNLKIKVRTACLKDNKVAERFIRSVGFVQYMETSTRLLFWINEKRLYNSPIYKRIYQKL